MRIFVRSSPPAHISKHYVVSVLAAAARETKNAVPGLSVDVSFVDQRTIRRLNRQYRNIDRATDILSFPYTDPRSVRTGRQVADRLLGELIIASEQLVLQARRAGRSPKSELRDLLIHGWLHLLGHDHVKPAERAAMRRFEDRIRARLSHRPPPVH